MATMGKQNVRHSRHPARLPSKMGSRTQEVRAVGAWVQSEPVSDYTRVSAVHSAQIEEQRIKEQQDEKSDRLRKFQEDVRCRVQALEKAKRQEALKKSFRAVEVERNVVHQSAFAAEKSTPWKNRCHHISLKHSVSATTHGDLTSDKNKEADEQFEEHSHQVRKFSSQARRTLTSRMVVTEHYLHDNLPGGVWLPRPSVDQDDPEECEPSDQKLENDVESDKENTGDVEIVAFDPETGLEMTSPASVPTNGERPSCEPPVPSLYPGVESQEEKVRAQNQRALYRRLFMDIEREQVKENQRKRQHRKKINTIKREKEMERRLVEAEAERSVAATDPVTGETEAQSLLRKAAEQRSDERLHDQQTRQHQRSRESERFLEALKRNLRERVELQKVDLPPLCCCGLTVWDTNPDTCANNCVFYRNPKAYARALQCLLASCDVV